MQYNHYPSSYQPTYYPSAQTTNRWDWVQGETGAKSYLVAPNTTVLLLDSENQRFYLKSADASGMPMPLRTFEYTETAQANAMAAFSPQENNPVYATKEDVAALARRIDALTKEAEANE